MSPASTHAPEMQDMGWVWVRGSEDLIKLDHAHHPLSIPVVSSGKPATRTLSFSPFPFLPLFIRTVGKKINCETPSLS